MFLKQKKKKVQHLGIFSISKCTVCVRVCAYVYYSPQCRHGDNSVPEGSWDAGELAGAGALLCVEHDCGEDDDGHGEREEEEAKL